LDLGLARLLPAPEAGAGEPLDVIRLTQQGQLLGTPHYMPPEQARDARAADARSDIYALGCTWHYLLTGRPPYGGGTMVEKLMAHRDAPIPSLRDARADASERLDAAFRLFVEKRPQDRYQSMTEAIAALDACALLDECAKRATPDESTADGSLAHFGYECAVEAFSDQVTLVTRIDHTRCDIPPAGTSPMPPSDGQCAGASGQEAAPLAPSSSDASAARLEEPSQPSWRMSIVLFVLAGIAALLLVLAAVALWLTR
jgi:serine/threonine protein kinase